MAFETPELDIYRYHEGMVRCGRVTKVSVNGCVAATVTFPDRGFQSGYMTVMQRNTIGAQDYYVPEEGEPVWVLMQGRSLSRGMILGSAYTEGNAPPFNSRTIRGVKFKDGSYMIYDSAGAGNYQIYTPGKITAQSGGDANITCGGNLTITVSNQATIKAPAIVLVGGVEIQGPLKVDGTTNLAAGGSATPNLRNTDGSGGGT